MRKPIPCAFCGTEFKPKRKGRECCSHACANKRRMKVRDGERPNPAHHMNLVWALATEAARKYGGLQEEWVGQVYELMADAAARFDPSRPAGFPTYAVSRIRWRLHDEFRSQRMGRNVAGDNHAARSATRVVHDEGWSKRRDFAAECPLASAIMWEAADRFRDATMPDDAAGRAMYLMARGMRIFQMADAEGVGRTTMQNYIRAARLACGGPTNPHGNGPKSKQEAA